MNLTLVFMYSLHEEFKEMTKELFMHGMLLKTTFLFFIIYLFVLQADKFLKCDWLRPVVFKPNLKYLHVKITPVTRSGKFLCLVV